MWIKLVLYCKPVIYKIILFYKIIIVSSYFMALDL